MKGRERRGRMKTGMVNGPEKELPSSARREHNRHVVFEASMGTFNSLEEKTKEKN